MLKLILLITPRIEQVHDIAEAWEAAGVTGVTFIESTGFHSLRQAVDKPNVLPGMMSLIEILRQHNEHNIVLLSVVEEDRVTQLLEITEGIIDNINLPDNGVLFVLPVEQAFGLRQPH